MKVYLNVCILFIHLCDEQKPFFSQQHNGDEKISNVLHKNTDENFEITILNARNWVRTESSFKKRRKNNENTLGSTVTAVAPDCFKSSISK